MFGLLHPRVSSHLHPIVKKGDYMKKLSVIMVLLSILLLGVGLTLFVYYGFYLKEYHTVPYDFHVENRVVGMNVDTDALHFGTVSPGGNSRRVMTITPSSDSRLVINFVGDGAGYLSVDKNNLLVLQGKQINVTFRVTIPENASVGNYSGKARFFFYRR